MECTVSSYLFAFIDVLKSPRGNSERFVLVTLKYRHIDDLRSFTLQTESLNITMTTAKDTLGQEVIIFNMG